LRIKEQETCLTLHEHDDDDDKYPNRIVGRDSSVGIATRYGLEGPGIESKPALAPTQPPIQWVPGLSLEGGKAAGAWR
jgi:hypothetical protein